MGSNDLPKELVALADRVVLVGGLPFQQKFASVPDFEIDWSRAATVPRQHQKDGVQALLKRPFFILADEVGAGKSKQVVDAAQVLFEAGLIDTVVVACPAFARGVWANPDPALGEVAKHGWPSVPNYVVEYSVKYPKALTHSHPAGELVWIVTNYEFIRRAERLGPLMAYLTRRKFMLVADEGWSLKDSKSDQWKATFAIREKAARMVQLNGTPIADTPLDLFAQMKLFDWRILGYKYFMHFRARYALLRPNVSFPMITGWQNLEELRDKVSPYILRRKTRDCFDLPPILEPVLIEAKLKDETWRIYKQMRDEMVAWIDSDAASGEASVAKQAIVKVLRLAQITSGYLGGLQKLDLLNESEPMLDFDQPGYHPLVSTDDDGPKVREIGREKLDALIEWLASQPPVDRILIWCRFRAEVERTAEALAIDGRVMHKLYGSQPPGERAAAVAALNPAIPYQGLVGVAGNPLAGGAALNLAGASLAVNLSLDTKLRVYLQARGRIDRPGQTRSIRYADVVATGPKGQRTMDHHILAALRGKNDLAQWTASTWRAKLLEE